MMAHIAKQAGFVVIGYVVAIIVTVVPVWRVTLITGPTAYYWTEEGKLVGPEFTAFIFTVTDLAVWFFFPALVLILVAELIRRRRLWIYIIGWLLILAVFMFSDSLPFSPAAKMTAILSALLGGFIYWVIAGRHMGRPIEVGSP
jgi:hypothetical protein